MIETFLKEFLWFKFYETEMFLIFSDSEDSDEEGGLGNVNRLIIRPAGHSGKAKKGF